MNGLATDQCVYRSGFRPNDHALTNQLLRIPTTDGLCIDESVVVDVRYDHSDLIAVTSEHDSPRRIRIYDDRDITVNICRNFICKSAGVFAYNVLDVLFITGRTRCV